MSKDFNKGRHNVFKTLGASNHTEKEREHDDFYATDSFAIDVLCSVEKFEGDIWECAAGQGHLSERLKQFNYSVDSTDLIDRNYCESNIDFLQQTQMYNNCKNIVTNPPYKYAKEFVYKAMELLPNNGKLALFLKLQFMEGKERKKMFKLYPPKVIYVSSSRILCAKNADFEGIKAGGGSAVAYAWYVWEKGFEGDPIVKWVN